ncbi:hypothetical protein DIU36_19720 [Mucilaginibacter rubeus]|nr:hypothetical protein DIU36_19720 [Mucilaginibacter rubeus]
MKKCRIANCKSLTSLDASSLKSF